MVFSLACPHYRVHRKSKNKEITFEEGKLQASGTIEEKEHQSSSRKGKSRSSTLKLANNTKNVPMNKKNIRTSTKSPSSLEKACSFQIIIFCSSESGKWYIAKHCSTWLQSRSSSYHTNHMPLNKTDMTVQKRLLDDSTIEKINILIGSGASNNSIVSAIKLEFNISITVGQVKRFREDRVNSILSLCKDDVIPKSAAERLIALFKQMKNVSYVYVKHNQKSGFVTYCKGKQETSDFHQSMTDDIEAWRKALKLGDDKDILVSFAWCHDEEKRMMVMFPEYLCTDMTFGLNREQRNLVTFVGCDGHKKTFIGFRCWMPSKQKIAYQWAIGVALPSLVGVKVTLKNKVISSDAELSLVEAVEASIHSPDGPLRNSKFRKDYYHLVKQPWHKLMAVVTRNTQGIIVTKIIDGWIRSWFNYVLTEAEYHVSHMKMGDYLLNNRHIVGELLFIGIKKIVSTVAANISCVGNHHFTTLSTFGFIGSSIVEGQNPSIKNGDLAANQSMSLDTSSLQQLHQVDRKSEKRNIEMARQINYTNHWTRSKTNRFLTRYMEGLAIKNFDLRGKYYTCYAAYRTWYVISKRTIDDYLSEVKSPNVGLKNDHTKFDRVHIVSVDIEGFMNCTCGYVHEFLAPCRHLMAVLDNIEYLVPSLFHIRWWKHFNYFFGSSYAMEEHGPMHDKLVAMHNLLHEKAFDSSMVFRGCCVLGTGFLDEDRSIDNESSHYHIMKAVRTYIQEVGPLLQGDVSFKRYLVDDDEMSNDMNENGFVNIFNNDIDFGGNGTLNSEVNGVKQTGSNIAGHCESDSDEDDGALDIEVETFCNGVPAIGHLSQASVGLEKLVAEQSSTIAVGDDLYHSNMAYLATIRTMDQRTRFEQFIRVEMSKNIQENNPEFSKKNRGMFMLGSDLSRGKQTGKRIRMAYERVKK